MLPDIIGCVGYWNLVGGRLILLESIYESVSIG